MPLASVLPRIFQHPGFSLFHPMPHRAGDVILVVEESRGIAHQECRHDLFDENDAAPPFFTSKSPHIKPQIHLFKALVKKHRDPEDLRPLEKKSNQRYVSNAAIGIDDGASRCERLKQFTLDWIIEHHQIAPFGREKGLSS